MKFYTLFILLVTCLPASYGQDGGLPSDNGIGKALYDVQELLRLPEVPTLHASDSLIARSEEPLNSLLIDHYWQATAQDSIDFGFAHQASLNFQRREALFGAGFQLGGQLFMNDWQVDKGRSGLRLNFDRRRLLDKLKTIHQASFDSEQIRQLQRLQHINPRLAAAAKVTQFEQYLQTINSTTYQLLHRELKQRTDTLLLKPVATLTQEEATWMARRKKLDTFTAQYRHLLQDVREFPATWRADAQHVVDSCRNVVAGNAEELFRQKLLKSPGLGLIRKALLLSKKFSIGNTRLGENELTSIGLPIRGINYAYGHDAVSLEIQHGKRIISDRFTPRDGLVFHDQQRNMRLSRIALALQPGKNQRYVVSAILGREQPSGTSNFPRTNRVFGIEGLSSISPKISVITDAHYAVTELVGRAPTDPSPNAPTVLGQAAFRFGAGFEIGHNEVQVAAFHRGKDFTSFANPYLIRDYQGIESTIRLRSESGRLTGDFNLAYGAGTQPDSKDNLRWQARGQVRARLHRQWSVGLMASPNLFRYEVSGQEGFTNSSIYRADLQGNCQIGERRLTMNISVTNLDQGWAWNDTTRVTNSALLNATGSLEFTEKLALTADVLRTLVTTSNQEWNHALAVTWSGHFRLTAGLRYDKYRFEERAAPGATLDLQFPIGKFSAAHFSLFYRASGAQKNLNSPPQLFSQQNWESRF